MTQTRLSMAEVLSTIRTVKELLNKLESRLIGAAEEVVDPYKRRKELLQRIYSGGNNVGKDDLLPLLEASGTNSRWIGQQVKMGYVLVIPVPGGSTRYAVTQKAVRELHLRREAEEESLPLARLAEPSFAEDWNSPEDAIYDNL